MSKYENVTTNTLKKKNVIENMKVTNMRTIVYVEVTEHITSVVKEDFVLWCMQIR